MAVAEFELGWMPSRARDPAASREGPRHCLKAVILWLFAVWISACSGVPVRGTIGMQTVETRVDSEAARYYVENYLAGIRADTRLDSRIDRVYQSANGDLPDRVELKRLSDGFSVDFAALYLTDRVVALPRNRRFRNIFDAAYDYVRKTYLKKLKLPAGSTQYEVLVVPIYLYKRLPGSGADLAAPRKALKNAGIPSYFVETDDDAAIEANADLVAAAIRDRGRSGRRLIIVSASKSGSEVALALTQLDPAETRHVAAWINAVGVLQGTPLVGGRLFRELEFLVGEMDVGGKESLTVGVSRQRFESFRVPKHVLVVNYVGVPLTGSVSFWASRGFSMLRKYGPNDGVSLLADSIFPRGITVADLGNDHFMRAKPMDVTTVALTMAVIRWLEDPGASRSYQEVRIP